MTTPAAHPHAHTHRDAVRAREWRLVSLAIFAMAMGWLEAVVVVYIRALLGVARGAGTPAMDEFMQRAVSLPWLMRTEQTRELATLVMLAAVGWLAGRNALARFGCFLVAFGVWDITYYVALYVLLGWPPSLVTRDLLFLIPPHPWWYQPVWLPVAISCMMIVIGVRFARRPGAITGPL